MSINGFIQKAIEKFTGFFTVISGDHRYIHEQKAYDIIGTATINDAATLKFSFTTPDAIKGQDKKFIHWRPAGISTSAAGVFYGLYIGSTSISGGSAVTAINRNHNSIKKSQITTWMQGATVTDGTLVQSGSFGTAGNPARAAGGGGGEDNEIILKSNTTYTISLVNLGGANSVVTWDFFWYEEGKGYN